MSKTKTNRTLFLATFQTGSGLELAGYGLKYQTLIRISQSQIQIVIFDIPIRIRPFRIPTGILTSRNARKWQIRVYIFRPHLENGKAQIAAVMRHLDVK